MEPFRTKIPNNFSLPRRINRLGELAYNLWWTWNPDSQRLYSRIDKDLWDNLEHNPVLFLRQVERSCLNAVTNNRYYLEYYDRMLRSFDKYMQSEGTWFTRTHPEVLNKPIAYFSMEYGLHEIFPIYAGGLGVLSGDHVKEASDLGLPFIAIGLYYSEGYFSQRITEDGWQEARYVSHSLDDLPKATIWQRTELAHGIEWGVGLGGAAGLMGVLLAMVFPPAGLSLGMGSLLVGTAAGAVFGAVVTALIGSQEHNRKLDAFQRALASGQVLLMADVSRNRVDEVTDSILRHHPEAEIGSAQAPRRR